MWMCFIDMSLTGREKTSKEIGKLCFIFNTKLSLFLLKQNQKDNLRMLSYFSANFLSF